MTFDNEKKTYLAKTDKSKKGEIDEKIIPLLDLINAHPDYYTTSSCSGRVYLWRGSGKKNETEWLKVSHDLIDEHFLDKNLLDKSGLSKKSQSPHFLGDEKDVVWLRLEGMILHVACRDLMAANKLIDKVRVVYKKSCILSASNKIIVEIRGSEFLEMPLYEVDGEDDENGQYNDNIKLLFSGEMGWLVELINQKMEKMGGGIEKCQKLMTHF